MRYCVNLKQIKPVNRIIRGLLYDPSIFHFFSIFQKISRHLQVHDCTCHPLTGPRHDPCTRCDGMSLGSAVYAVGMHNSTIVITGNRCIQNVSRTETRVSRLRSTPEDCYLCDTLTAYKRSITGKSGNERQKLFNRERPTQEQTLLSTMIDEEVTDGE